MSIHRRNFLKCVGVGSVALSMPGAFGCINGELKGSKNFVKSICEMCSTRCPIEARLENEKRIFIQGNIYSKSTQGSICARGGAGVNQLFDPKRLVKPLMRVGKRGEGKYKEISWDEAYEFIALKLNGIKQNYGAQSVAFAAKGGPETTFLNQFAYAYGSPNIFDHGSTCPSAYATALTSVYGTSSLSRDFADTKFMLNFGHNVYEGIVISYARGITKALSKGAKLVSFDPRFSILSSKASEWHPIRPGGDTAFMLGFVHTLIFNNLYDKKFVEKYTVGFDKLKESIKDYTPETMAQYCDISAEKIISLAKEAASFAPHCIIDYGHRATFTTEEIELRRAIAIANALLGNIECKGGMYFPKGAKLYNKIAGEEVAPEFKSSILPSIESPKIARIDGIDIKEGEFSKISKKRGIYSKVFDAILSEKPYPIKGLFITRSNPVMTNNESQKVVEALEKLELFVCVDVYLSDTAQYADIILPESTYLERDEQFLSNNGKNPGYQVRQKVIEPIGDTKASSLIYKELAEKMGLGKFFPYKDIEDFRMKQAFNYPKEIYELKSKGVLSYGIPLLARDKDSIAKFVEKYPNSKQFLDEDGEFGELLKCKTKSGKIELFDEVFENACKRGGLSFNDPKLKTEDEKFYFIQGKVAVHTNGHTANVPWLNQLMDNNAVWINQKVADELGLKKGDSIKIKSKIGEQIAQVLPTIGIREDTIFAYFGFGHTSKHQEISYNKGMSASHLLANTFSPIAGNNVHTIGVNIEKI
ncbi:thiosulfate reductase PhsA [Campylobacter helveticus]|uniref:thiosulfate reductase PhsA n=1 Tax=Campylobacter helveticus TaxID=28898 RepID=UPI001115C834|nr:thiosulfate reductase PhsA [Campylobacter helveticus]TNH32751.1 thiosulfate reductase PhsA [Campylobacter helveticus]